MVKKNKKERTAAVPYEVQVYDVIYSKSARYRVLSFIGEGSFGKVAKCVDLKTAKTAAIKIHKDCRSYEIQREVAMLERLRAVDPDRYNLVRFLDSFMFKDLSCLAFEMLDKSLYNFMSERETGLHLNEIRPIAHQLLVAFEALKAMGIVHGDLKPDNVMLVNHKDEPFRVKLIDFGLAIPVAKARIGRVMQAVAYRAPEVTLGLPLSEAMDMWGLGCVLALLYFREHLFPGSSNYYLIQAVCHLLGQPDDHLLDYGRKTWKYFNRGRRDPRWILKTPMEYKKATGIMPKTSEWGFKEFVDLREAVVKHGYENGSGRLVDRRAFTHLLRRLLNLDAEKRITPDEALGLHFVTMKHLQKKNINNSADEALKLMKFASEDYFQRCDNSPSDSESVMQSTDIGVVTQSTDPGVSSKGFSGWKDIVPGVTYDNPPPTPALSIENNERSSQIEIIIPISHVSSFLEENIKEPSDNKASAGIHSDGTFNTDSHSEGELVSSRSKEDSATCGDDKTSSKRESPGIIKKDPLPENLSAEHSEYSTEELDTDGAVYKAPSTPPTTALGTDILNASYWASPRDYCNQEISSEIEITPISDNSSFLEENSIEPSNDMASAGLDSYGPLDTDSYSEGKLLDTDSYSEGKLVALRSKEDPETSGDEIPANTSSKRESPRVIECPPLELSVRGYYSDSSDEGLDTDGAGCKAPSTPESTDRLMVISSSQDSAPVQPSSPEHGYHNTPPKTVLSTDILINASYWTSPRDHCNKERSREIEIVTPISQNVCILEENDIEPRNDMAPAGMDSYETSDTECDSEQELVCFSSKEYSAKSRDEIPANTSSKRESPQVIEWPPLELGYYSDSSDEGLDTDGARCKAPSTPESTDRSTVISSSQDSVQVQLSSPEQTETSEERLQAMKTQRQLQAQAIIKARLEKAFITTANVGGACGVVVRTPTHPIYQIKKINGQNAPANVTHDDSTDSAPANNGAAAAITSVDLDNHNNGPGRARQAKPFDRMVKLASRIKSAVVSVFRRRNRVYATKVLCTAS